MGESDGEERVADPSPLRSFTADHVDTHLPFLSCSQSSSPFPLRPRAPRPRDLLWHSMSLPEASSTCRINYVEHYEYRLTSTLQGNTIHSSSSVFSLPYSHLPLCFRSFTCLSFPHGVPNCILPLFSIPTCCSAILSCLLFAYSFLPHLSLPALPHCILSSFFLLPQFPPDFSLPLLCRPVSCLPFLLLLLLAP